MTPALVARVRSNSAPGRLPDTTHDVHGDCLLWLGRRTVKGYGITSIDGTTYRVHRVLWQAEHGPVPPGMVLDHRCHDETRCRRGNDCLHRRCLNPDHLVLVTHGENSARTSRSPAARVRPG